ncbi:hypothetical protein LTR29_017870, partial [Friedmanniomyces endolithicus]
PHHRQDERRGPAGDREHHGDHARLDARRQASGRHRGVELGDPGAVVRPPARAV